MQAPAVAALLSPHAPRPPHTAPLDVTGHAMSHAAPTQPASHSQACTSVPSAAHSLSSAPPLRHLHTPRPVQPPSAPVHSGCAHAAPCQPASHTHWCASPAPVPTLQVPWPAQDWPPNSLQLGSSHEAPLHPASHTQAYCAVPLPSRPESTQAPCPPEAQPGPQPLEVQPSPSHGARHRHSVHAHVPRAGPPHSACASPVLGQRPASSSPAAARECSPG